MRFLLFFSSFVIAVVAVLLAYLMISDNHAVFRAAFGQGREVRQIAAVNAVDFEKAHFKALFGDKEAQFKTGRYLTTGETGTQNQKKAIRWFRRAAEKGHAEASLALARIFFLGKGVEKDEAEGARWTKVAADAGSMRAIGLMGILHMGGIGVEQDFGKARAWLTKSDDPMAIELALVLQNLDAATQSLPPLEKKLEMEMNYASAKKDIGASFIKMIEEETKQ